MICALLLTGCASRLRLPEDGAKIYICELKGQSSEEWIADTLDLNFCNDIMVYKEITVDAIPDGMSSEYEWNQ